MTPLRQRFIDVLTLRGYSQRIHEGYVAAVAALAGHYHRSPERIGSEEIRSYLPGHRHGYSASTINVAVSALRLFYAEVLRRPLEDLKQCLPRPRKQSCARGFTAARAGAAVHGWLYRPNASHLSDDGVWRGFEAY